MILLRPRLKYRVKSPKGFKARTNNKTPKTRGMEYHLNEALRKRGMTPWPTVGRTHS